MLKSKRWWRLMLASSAVIFGVFSGIIQLYLALWPKGHISGLPLLASMLLLSMIWGIGRAKPHRLVLRNFRRPDVTVEIKVGDLFDEPSHLVIGFNDVFDTDYSDNVVISHSSIQGQFQDRIYYGDIDRLNSHLRSALALFDVEATERRSEKRRGNLDRYPIGTIAVLGDADRRYFCVAYSKMQNNLTVRSNIDRLWSSLGRIWEAVYVHGQRASVAIPIIGSEMARVNHLDREVILRMILLSFMARSRQDLICKKLTIVIHPNDAHQVNMLEIEAFLRAL
ncbi:macro domain-containing protein [Streptacidiphilus sp. EB103A]|uniref:macro domain-containing protein n=1 Tax=Streptacidiphilus sp. EB103A TaxID=3156275 RepID=UPI0035161217